MTRPIIIGLTGSIGMGKSTVAQMFRDLSVPVFDADAVVHRMQAHGGSLVAEIEARFPGTTGPDGVDRIALGNQVFDNPAALAGLEAIVHPAVAREREAFLLENAGADAVVLDIPLLFEKAATGLLHRIVVVSTEQATQRARILARPGMTPARFAEIMALQTPDAEKRARADHVIDTGLTLAETRAQVAALVTCFRAAARR